MINSKKRSVYRTWTNYDDNSINYLLISPSGSMRQITFTKDIYGEKVKVYQTSPLNPLDPATFIKCKKVCTQADWLKAQKKAIALIK